MMKSGKLLTKVYLAVVVVVVVLDVMFVYSDVMT